MTRSAGVSVTIALVVFAFCARTISAADCQLEGTISVAGKPIASGKVTFWLGNGQFFGSKVKDGKFAVHNVPGGTFKVSIQGEGVPARFADEETSGLMVEVKAETIANRIDFDLAP